MILSPMPRVLPPSLVAQPSIPEALPRWDSTARGAENITSVGSSGIQTCQTLLPSWAGAGGRKGCFSSSKELLQRTAFCSTGSIRHRGASFVPTQGCVHALQGGAALGAEPICQAAGANPQHRAWHPAPRARPSGEQMGCRSWVARGALCRTRPHLIPRLASEGGEPLSLLPARHRSRAEVLPPLSGCPGALGLQPTAANGTGARGSSAVRNSRWRKGSAAPPPRGHAGGCGIAPRPG